MDKGWVWGFPEIGGGWLWGGGHSLTSGGGTGGKKPPKVPVRTVPDLNAPTSTRKQRVGKSWVGMGGSPGAGLRIPGG